MEGEFPIHDISSWPSLDDEPMGTKAKCWIVESVGDFGKKGLENRVTKWLFKARARDHARDDCTEKLASHLAELLGIPHARVELAHRRGSPGVICLDFVREQNAEVLDHGNSLLAVIEEAPNGLPTKVFHAPDHSLERIFRALDSNAVVAPLQFRNSTAIQSGIHVFVGYLLFDAWISNTDRHHENWGALRFTDGRKVLAPSYDHATSLGHNLSDQKKWDLLEESNGAGVGVYLHSPKAASAIYLDQGRTKTTPFGVFQAASAICPAASAYWLDRLRQISDERMTEIVGRLPGMLFSDIGKRFTSEFLAVSRARLLAPSV